MPAPAGPKPSRQSPLPSRLDGLGRVAGRAALDRAAELAVSAGGTLADHQPRPDLRIVLDPAGHPLCLFLH